MIGTRVAVIVFLPIAGKFNWLWVPNGGGMPASGAGVFEFRLPYMDFASYLEERLYLRHI